MEEDSKGTGLGNVIRIDDERVREHLGHIVRGTVEETLNAMLEAEADRLCNAGRYERTAARRDHRLRWQAADQGRRGDAEGSEAAPADVRDSDHRALSAAREFSSSKPITKRLSMPGRPLSL